MKTMRGLLWALLAVQGRALQDHAAIHFSDSTPVAHEPTPIAPAAARLLLAQRLGLAQYHDLKDADEAIFALLNGNERHKHTVFAAQESRNQLVIFVENVHRLEDIVDSDHHSSYDIADSPPATDSQKLASDFMLQDSHRRGQRYEACSLDLSKQTGLAYGRINGLSVTPQQCKTLKEHISRISSQQTLASLARVLSVPSSYDVAHTTVLFVDVLKHLSPKDGNAYNEAVSDIRSFITLLQHPHTDSAIVLLPPTSKTGKYSTYGSYEVPVLHQKRQDSQMPEQVLSSTHAASPKIKSKPVSNSQAGDGKSPLPHGVIPTCHSSLDQANAATNNCSGHGEVYVKSKGRSGDGDKAIDCYACRCNSTRILSDDGKVKTLYWGGPACQKKDVSTSFFLLFGITLGLLGITGWGVSLLASIGQEDLPSVIGAGVAGPRAQK